MTSPLLSIVIPLYNEEEIVVAEVINIVEMMQELLPTCSYELLLIENGSVDTTAEKAFSLARRFNSVKVIQSPVASYGRALKRGMLEAQGDLIVLFNIDLWDVQFIRDSLSHIKNNNYDIIVGSKTMMGARDHRTFIRRLITRSFNSLLRRIFGFVGTDTHGIKILKREKIVPLVNACVTEKEIFDSELILRAQHAGLKKKEIPVECIEKRQTTTSILRRIPRTLRDLATLYSIFKKRT